MYRSSLVVQLVKNLPAMWETWVQSLLGCEDLLEKGKATHFSILAWKTPWVGHDWLPTFTHFQCIGRDTHMVKGRLKARMGARMNIEIDVLAGHKGSLINSLHQQWVEVDLMVLWHLRLFGIACSLELFIWLVLKMLQLKEWGIWVLEC